MRKNSEDQAQESIIPRYPSLNFQEENDIYYPISEEPDYTELETFLSSLGIERENIPVNSEYLLPLFQHEMGFLPWVKWSSLDHALEKLLQWPLLSSSDFGAVKKNRLCARVRPAERSIPLNSTWALMKAYGVQGFTRGLEMGIFTSVHLFIYAMLMYRLVTLFKTEQMSQAELRSSFVGTDEAGIDSLVYLLAHIQKQALQLILTSPLIIAGVSSLFSLWGSQLTSADRFNGLIQHIESHLIKGSRWWYDGIYEALPFISSLSYLSTAGKLQKLESLIRWDGRIASADRQRAVDVLCRAALEGNQAVQRQALCSLAKIAHGVGFKDLPRLHAAGVSADELISILYSKGKSLEILSRSPAKDVSYWASVKSLPQRGYRQYLLWWLLGFHTHIFKQQLPTLLLKGVKLTIELYYFQMIVLSILEAIRCPDKPGFQLGFGYSQYANLLTTPCYLEMITQFRSVNLNDSVAQLVAQTQYFNLLGLSSLELWYKNLTGSEMVDILQSAEESGAIFTEIQIYDIFQNSDMQALANDYLNTSKLQLLALGASQSSGDPTGGIGLTNQGFEYLTQVLPYMQDLINLYVDFPLVSDPGVQMLATILNTTQINSLFVGVNAGDPGTIPLANILATMPMIAIALYSDPMGDETIQALAPVVNNNRNLTALAIQGHAISNDGAKFFAQMIQNSSLSSVQLRSIRITDEGMIALAEVIPSLPLQKLGIGSRSGETGIIALANQLNKTKVWELELWDNIFTPQSMQVLATALPSTEITKLILGNNNLHDENITIELSQGIAASPRIQHLNIYFNIMNKTISLLAPAFPQLQTLELIDSDLTDANILSIAPFIKVSVLQSLQLTNNPFGDDGAAALAAVLTDTSITYLDLENNQIADAGAQALANVYSATALQTLYLAENNISSDILYNVENYQWGAYCQDQICHTNTKYNGYSATQTSSATRLQPLPFYLLSWLRSFFPPTKTAPLFLQSSAAPKVVISIPKRSCLLADGGDNIVTEIGYDEKCLIKPGKLFNSVQVLMVASPHWLLTGALAIVHTIINQGVTTLLLATGHSARTTRLTVMAYHIALSVSEARQFISLLLPFAVNQTVRLGAHQLSGNNSVAQFFGFAAGLMVTIVKNATSQGLLMLTITILASQVTEKVIQQAKKYVLPAKYQSLEPELLHGKINSLQLELKRARSSVSDKKDQAVLQDYEKQLAAIHQDHHATLKTIMDLRQGIRRLPQKPGAKNSVVFFKSLPPVAAKSSSSGCLDRIYRKLGFM